jgi:hypothetical protein
MAPSQLSRQCLDNFKIGKSLSEPEHVEEVGARESGPVFAGQVLRQPGNQAFSVLQYVITIAELMA